MVFKTNDKLESPYPFKHDKNDRHYFGFEVVLNVGLYHVDLLMEHNDDVYHTRFISYEIDMILQLLSGNKIIEIDLYYQPSRYEDSEDYQILKIKEVSTADDGLKFTFFNGETLEDPLQHSRKQGLLYQA